MYNLNSNSNSAKFFNWIWHKDVTEYKTMCPYFWNYVLTILFIVPILAVKLIVGLFPKKAVVKTQNYIAYSKVGDLTENIVEAISSKVNFWSKVGNILKWLFIIMIGAFGLAFLGFIIYNFIVYPLETFAFIGVITSLVGIVALIVYIFSEYDLGSKIAYPFKLFGNMVSSLYHKACPLVRWN
jgi:hypothetical protein